MEQKQISKKENTVLTETDGLDTDRLSHFISGQQVQIRAGTRFNTVEKFCNRKNFGRFIEEILVLIDKKDSYIYDINNFLTN